MVCGAVVVVRLCGQDEGWLRDFSYLHAEEGDDMAVPGWLDLWVEDCGFDISSWFRFESGGL